MPAPGDLIQETTSTTGTGNITLDGAVFGRRTFNTEYGTGGSNVFDYYISHRSAAEWERGTGSLSTSSTLVRDTVIASSNANAAVNFSAGTKDVSNDIPAALQARFSAAQTDHAIVRGDGTAGAVQTSGVTIDDSNNVAGVAALSATTIELGHASDTTLARVSAGVVSIEGSNILLASGLGSITQAYDADTLKADTADTLTAGYDATSHNLGTVTGSNQSIAPAYSNGNTQYALLNGSSLTGTLTITPPSTSGTILLLLKNGGSGAVAATFTTSAFEIVTGDTYAGTNGNEYLCYITTVYDSTTHFSHLHVTALQ